MIVNYKNVRNEKGKGKRKEMEIYVCSKNQAGKVLEPSKNWNRETSNNFYMGRPNICV